MMGKFDGVSTRKLEDERDRLRVLCADITNCLAEVKTELMRRALTDPPPN